MTSTKDFDIAIIGGGIAGLTLAIALHHRAIKVQVYEQAKQFGEIGAGVSFTANALQAMKLCHNEVYDAFEKVCTRNLWPSKQKVWFDYFDAYGKESESLERSEYVFTISNEIGQNGVHRARFLDELIHLFPEELCHFHKHLSQITEDGSGKSIMHFADGLTAEADAIIGCDGIKSKVRQLLHGEHHACGQPTYTYKYAYRGFVPMKQAVDALGEERASNSCMHLGPGGHVLTFPVNHGEILNIVAFTTTETGWTEMTGRGSDKLTAPARRDDALKDFEGFSGDVQRLLKLCKPDLDIWAIFDLADNPPPSYAKGRVAILGDAAHATSPHHGAGAGLCIEDSAVMAELLADEQVKTRSDLEVAFATFSKVRKERGDNLVQSSRRQARIYEGQTEYGMDAKKQEAEINERNAKISDIDLRKMCDEARSVMYESMR
jgi:salicylate hydroxylase